MRHSAVSRYHWLSGRMSAEFNVGRLTVSAIFPLHFTFKPTGQRFMRFIAVKTLGNLRLVIGVAALFGFSAAQALILDVQITPADGFVSVGQEVGMVLTVTNDSNVPRPGLTIITTNDIDGLSFPMEVTPCVLGVAQLNPPTSPISYVLLWRLTDLAPNESRRCETKFRVRTIPNGAIPVFFSQGLSFLAQVTYRVKPLISAPTLTPLGLGALVILFLLVAMRSYNSD